MQKKPNAKKNLAVKKKASSMQKPPKHAEKIGRSACANRQASWWKFLLQYIPGYRGLDTYRSGDALNDIKVGDELEVATDRGGIQRFVFLRKESNNEGADSYIFQRNKMQYRYNSDGTRLLLASGTIRRAREVSEKESKQLLHRANDSRISKIVRDCSPAQCDSLVSVPVSPNAHRQQGGTCYAHACATVIRAVENRIVGRKLEPFDDLVTAIIDKHGSNGGNSVNVLEEWCPDKKLRFSVHKGGEHDAVLDALRAGRVVLASFELPKNQWRLFSIFFKQHPSGILTKDDFENDPFPSENFPPELREETGHAIVITGFCEKDGKVIYKVKNSWGVNFARDGYFHIEADAFPRGFRCCIDVYFVVSDLPNDDIRNFLLHVMKEKCCVDVDEDDVMYVGAGTLSIPFMFVEDSPESESWYRNHSDTEKDAADIINGRLSFASAGKVKVSQNGRIAVSGSDFCFRAVSMISAE